MTIDSIDITKAVQDIEKLLALEKGLSPTMASAIRVLLLVIKLLVDRVGLNSRNSSKPPATDPNRTKEARQNTGKARGGQQGHPGSTLCPVDDPDEVRRINIDKRRLPQGEYQEAGFEARQVIDIHISRVVTENQAQILQNAQGQRFVAEFPPGITRPVQYGASVKAHAVYLSMFQLIPYERIQAQFDEQLDIVLSTGSLVNFNREVYERLALFEPLARQQLAQSSLIHADETGINIDGIRHWLHNASNRRWTLFLPHEKRGAEAINAMGILPGFRGILMHDHWKPYYLYACAHALCNAHHLRELTRAFEQDGQQWARQLHDFLLSLNEAVDRAGGALEKKEATAWRRKYRNHLKKADEECPPPTSVDNPRRGRQARSKARNLLERLRDYEDDVLRFMENPDVPFTNNQGERDIRMTKVQQKISGCFRSMEGAQIFCRIRSYLSTCKKQGVGAGEALTCLFEGRWPTFIQNLLNDQGACAE